MLARDGVVLVKFHLLRRLAGILLGYIEEAGSGGADQLDEYGSRFGHGDARSLAKFNPGPGR